MTDDLDEKIQFGTVNLSGRENVITFPGMDHKSLIRDGMRDVDYEKEIRARVKSFMKAAPQIYRKALGPESGGTGTAGYGLVPVRVDPTITDRSRYETPFPHLLQSRVNIGMYAAYNVITAKGSPAFQYPDAALSVVDDTEAHESKPIKFFYVKGKILGPMIAAMPGYNLQGFRTAEPGGTSVFNDVFVGNAVQYEIQKKMQSMLEYENNMIWNADSSSDDRQFDGLIAQQSTTNVKDLEGAALSYDDVEEAVELALEDGGRPKIVVGSIGAITQLRQIMIDSGRYTMQGMRSGEKFAFGVPASFYLSTNAGDLPVIYDRFLSNTDAQKQLWFLDTDQIELRILQDFTVERLSRSNDAETFMIKKYMAVVNKATAFQSFIDNIA